MMKVADNTSDQDCRSLLQKAIRRGDDRITELAVIRLIQNKEKSWLKNRLGVIAFEESWRSVGDIQFTNDEAKLVEQYKDLASKFKNKNAAGLGSLAYEFSKGDVSVASGLDINTKHLKIVAEAIKRPGDFWAWISGLEVDHKKRIYFNNAEIGFKLAGWPWDKAFAQASAYLAVSDELSKVSIIDSGEDDVDVEFPYWVAIDKHTSAGKKALAYCAKKLNLDKNTLGWIQFYFESAKCKCLEDSFWWEQEKLWRMKREGFDINQAGLIWAEASECLREFVRPTELHMIQRLEDSARTYRAIIKKQDSLI